MKETHRAQALIPILVHLFQIQDQSLISHEVFAHLGMRRQSASFARLPEIRERYLGLIISSGHVVPK